jgi:hypothetical protein
MATVQSAGHSLLALGGIQSVTQIHTVDSQRLFLDLVEDVTVVIRSMLYFRIFLINAVWEIFRSFAALRRLMF